MWLPKSARRSEFSQSKSTGELWVSVSMFGPKKGVGLRYPGQLIQVWGSDWRKRFRFPGAKTKPWIMLIGSHLLGHETVLSYPRQVAG